MWFFLVSFVFLLLDTHIFSCFFCAFLVNLMKMVEQICGGFFGRWIDWRMCCWRFCFWIGGLFNGRWLVQGVIEIWVSGLWSDSCFSSFFFCVFCWVGKANRLFVLVEWVKSFGVYCYCGAALIEGGRIHFWTFCEGRKFSRTFVLYCFVCWDYCSLLWGFSCTTEVYDLRFVGVVCVSVLTELLSMVSKKRVIGICFSFLLCLAFFY